MSLFRKLVRRKAPPSVPGPSSQDSATDLATSNDVATERRLTELPSNEEQISKGQIAQHVPIHSGHSYDRVQTGGQSRNHLGDVYNKNVTYNYGAPFQYAESTKRQEDNEDVRLRSTARHSAGERLVEEKRAASEHQRLKFLEALKFDAMGSRTATVGPAHAETCTWIVEAAEYVKWRDESFRSEHHGVLWIKGKPGSGKSTLMKYALGIAQERSCGETIVSFFFNARGQPLESSAEGMYRSLLCQILTKLPHLYSNQIHVDQKSWPVELLENLFREILLSLKPEEHIVCYIDALDECTQTQVRDVVGRFEELVDLAVSRGLRASVCFTSRHYPHITMHKFEELKLDDQEEHLEDISTYIRSKVGWLSIPLSAKASVEADIQRRCSGIFL